MRHHNKNRKFGREHNQRRALMRSLANSLILEEKITTTEAKARSLRPYIEKLVTKGKSDDIASRRLIISRLGRENAANKLIEEISPRYNDRPGGYVRIIKLGHRASDASPMAVIEFVK